MDATAAPIDDADNRAGIIGLLLGMLFGGMILFGVLFKLGRHHPGSVQYAVAFTVRRVIVPSADNYLDWFACISYLTEPDARARLSGIAILSVLVVGSLMVSVLSVYQTTREYEHLKSLSNSVGSMGWGCVTGIFQLMPLFLGQRALKAWREIAESPRWRAAGVQYPPSEDKLHDFMELVAHVKHTIQFEAMLEGGPQLLIQTAVLISDWDTLVRQINSFQLSALMRVLSPAFSAWSMVLAQVDFLCENDRFTNKVFRREAPPVMLCVLLDLGAQLIVRVIPICVILDHNLPVGIGLVGGGGLVAVLVAAHAALDSEQGVCDTLINGVLFWPTPFFFAMTHHAGHSSKTGGSVAFQSSKRALLSTDGLYYGLLHLAFTLVACLCLATPGKGDRQPVLIGAAAAGMAIMVGARSVLFVLYRVRPEWFDLDATPQLPPPPSVESIPPPVELAERGACQSAASSSCDSVHSCGTTLTTTRSTAPSTRSNATSTATASGVDSVRLSFDDDEKTKPPRPVASMSQEANATMPRPFGALESSLAVQAPKNIVDARHAAALAAWPDMPTNLPLSLALEEDDDDDAKTKRGKAAARKAAQDAETQWSANVR